MAVFVTDLFLYLQIIIDYKRESRAAGTVPIRPGTNRYSTDMNPFYKIAIDRVNANYLSGWCMHRFRPDRPVRLHCRIGGRVVAEATADRFREDLVALGIHRSGRCGFEFVLADEHAAAGGQVLEITVPGSVPALLRLSTDSLEPVGIRRVVGRLRSLWPLRYRGRNIFFMHIPKTAGTSFNTLACSLLANDGVVAHLELSDRHHYPQLQKQNRYLSGHLSVGVWKSCFDLSRADLLTIVREPYGHLHSHLNWLIETATRSPDNYFKQQNPVIDDFGRRLAELDFSEPAAVQRFVVDLDDLGAAFLDNAQTRYFLDDQPRRTAPDDLQQALGNLSLFRAIGVTEAYPVFVDRFLACYHLRRPMRKSVLNRSVAPPLYDHTHPEFREVLAPLVDLDRRLYGEIQART